MTLPAVRIRRVRLAITLAGLLAAGCGAITGEQIGKILDTTGGRLDTETVVAGLKQALEVGTERTVTSTSKIDGYLANELIRIVMPGELKGMANTLRDVGFGGEVDKFEVGMNRAAEKAAGEATSVFWNSIKAMSFADAWGILNGDDSAATAYFRKQTSATLRSRYLPIVHDKMSEVGLYQVYQSLLDAYTALPFVTKPNFDLDAYITDRALGGLFTVLAQEEKRIRDDPVARTTDLLRRVFAEDWPTGPS
jgi:hypothetical protein